MGDLYLTGWVCQKILDSVPEIGDRVGVDKWISGEPYPYVNIIDYGYTEKIRTSKTKYTERGELHVSVFSESAQQRNDIIRAIDDAITFESDNGETIDPIISIRSGPEYTTVENGKNSEGYGIAHKTIVFLYDVQRESKNRPNQA